MPEPPTNLALSVVLHDVTPESWAVYRDFIDAVDAIGRVPLTLLVVPDYYHQFHLDRFPDFRSAIEQRIAQGDEVVLHGYYHNDDSPPRFNPLDMFMRRIYTREGEFYNLDEVRAKDRLERGLELFSRYGWAVSGFVAPAWLMSKGTQTALSRFSLSYTSTLSGLISLPDWKRLDAPTLVWSSRNAWRRKASIYWNRFRLAQSLSSPMIRLGLHPIDMRHADSIRFWQQTLESLLPIRTPQTKGQWVNSNRL